jgi:uncharacterized SAM-binding protein YcdF (DUF218 family)
MKLSEIDVNELSREQITKILFGDERDNRKSGDCIFVYGGKGIERVQKAVELYNRGRAKYILFSGGLKYGTYTRAEAITMKDNAIKFGVPAEAILTEELSNNTKENAISSLFTLENKFGIHTITNLLIVSIPWHYRRCLLTLKTYYPKWINYTWCPANYEKCQFNNWWKYSESYEYVIKEATNIVKFIKEGQLIDIEIEI